MSRATGNEIREPRKIRNKRFAATAAANGRRATTSSRKVDWVCENDYCPGGFKSAKVRVKRARDHSCGRGENKPYTPGINSRSMAGNFAVKAR